jgi:hypothetical protein
MPQEDLLGLAASPGVEGDGIKPGAFIEEQVGVGAVHAARRSEDESLDTLAAANVGQELD